jgi:hypothetical protein
LVGGFPARVKAGKASPNEGIKLSIKNSLAALVVGWLSVGLSVGVIGELIDGHGRWSYFLVFGLGIGMIAGTTVALNRGGSAVIKHYALRLVLWRPGKTPLVH